MSVETKEDECETCDNTRQVVGLPIGTSPLTHTGKCPDCDEDGAEACYEGYLAEKSGTRYLP